MRGRCKDVYHARLSAEQDIPRIGIDYMHVSEHGVTHKKDEVPDGDTVEVGVPAGVKPGTMFEMMVNGVKVRARAPNRGRQVVKVNLHRSDWTHLDL